MRDSEDPPRGRRYPPAYEKALPIILGLLVFAILLLIVVVVIVVLRSAVANTW